MSKFCVFEGFFVFSGVFLGFFFWLTMDLKAGKCSADSCTVPSDSVLSTWTSGGNP